ncbi:MAG: serine/threonine-protein kinase [Solirubrobacteraceae bacterium]
MTYQTTDVVSDSLIGSHIGDYHVDARIGEGGMGTVYKGTAPDGSPVALKVVKRDYARDETFRRRFEREARIAQTVRNPHVVPVLDTGVQDDIPYLVARYIDGCSLEDKLRTEHTLDVPTTVAITAQVANGLEALWAAGTVHRDVKPGNILIDSHGKAFITDFGLAKDNQGSVLTLPGQALGSVDYMSPEQIRGEPLTASTDVYALGCVVFECLHGQPPFADRQGMRVLWAHLQDEPPDLCAGRSDVVPRLGEAWKASMAKEPAERPESSVAFAISLAEAAGYRILTA